MATAKYEAMMVFSVKNAEEEVSALTEKFKTLIEKNGTLEKIDERGKRRLDYPINDEPDGHYVLVDFESGPDFPAEFTRVAKITEGVLRVLTIRK